METLNHARANATYYVFGGYLFKSKRPSRAVPQGWNVYQCRSQGCRLAVIGRGNEIQPFGGVIHHGHPPPDDVGKLRVIDRLVYRAINETTSTHTLYAEVMAELPGVEYSLESAASIIKKVRVKFGNPPQPLTLHSAHTTIMQAQYTSYRKHLNFANGDHSFYYGLLGDENGASFVMKSVPIAIIHATFIVTVLSSSHGWYFITFSSCSNEAERPDLRPLGYCFTDTMEVEALVATFSELLPVRQLVVDSTFHISPHSSVKAAITQLCPMAHIRVSPMLFALEVMSLFKLHNRHVSLNDVFRRDVEHRSAMNNCIALSMLRANHLQAAVNAHRSAESVHIN